MVFSNLFTLEVNGIDMIPKQWMVERNYTQGNLAVDVDPMVIFGKPVNIEKRFSKIFELSAADVTSNNNPFIKYIMSPALQLSERVVSTVKQNYINYLNNRRNVYQNAVTKIIQDMTNFEQTYIQQLARANVIVFDAVLGPGTDTGTDGLQQKNGDTRIYVTSGTTPVDSVPQVQLHLHQSLRLATTSCMHSILTTTAVPLTL